MKQLLPLTICTLFLLSALVAPGQTNSSLQVVYEFKYVRDLAQPDNPYTANMILSLSPQVSRYCTQKLYEEQEQQRLRQAQVQAEQKALSAQPATVVAGGPLLRVNKYGAIINEELMKDMAGQRLTIRAHMGFKYYRIDTALPRIDWKILSDKKTIGQYTCQKATGDYGGRKWEVWFAPDLAYQDGPWKLTGLPGLILEAQDSKREVSFVFVSAKTADNTEGALKSFLDRDRSILTDWKDYSRAKTAFEKDPEAVMAAWAPNAKLAVRNVDDPQATQVTRIKQYNPLEHVD
ncbi:MAG: GLPGLI family protein [Niastella sp.]|nr:GLPGLI family protein [Niastella sp.]